VARIALLPPGLVNQIAAGEVVERPASIVKELVENALDAGARAIQVEVEDGGLALVRVADDGSGMPDDDALLALERHATSKLRDAEGLAAIATMGFRGEALPAIASVSRFRLDTCAESGGGGTRVVVEGGRIVERGAIGRARGTTVEVRDLFFNTPARRKFMKSAAAEAGHVSEAVVRLALARRDVAFTLRSGGRVALASPAGASERERAAAALGREAAERLVPVDGGRGELRVRGVVTAPDHSEATSRAFYLFVNGRYVRDRAIAHAVLRAYAGVLPPGRHPAAVLFLDLPLASVDVNVHPQKLEVRFADGRAVVDAVHHAVAGALRTAPWLAHHRHAAPDGPGVPVAAEPITDGVAAASPHATATILARAWAVDDRTAALPLPLAAPPDAALPLRLAAPPDAAQDVAARRLGIAPPQPPAEGAAAGFFGALRYVGQHARTYLLCESPTGSLVVVDQHASHERLLFHRLSTAWRARAIPVQPLLVPVVVTLPPGPARVIEAAAPELAGLGLDVEPFGGDAFAVKSLPAPLGGVDVAALLRDLALQFEEAERGAAIDVALHDVLATMACHAAIRAHQELAPEEARALLAGLDAIDFKGRCPHGRPVVFELPLADLERRVGRR
jgi:DNA mismatch repair protein MutL